MWDNLSESCLFENITAENATALCNDSRNGSLSSVPPSGNAALNLTQNITGILALILFMVTSGCTVDAKDLLSHLKRPWAILVGMGCQYIVLPLLSFCGALVFSLDPNQAVAFMVINTCPGGPLSNMMTLAMDGDLSLRYVKKNCY